LINVLIGKHMVILSGFLILLISFKWRFQLNKPNTSITFHMLEVWSICYVNGMEISSKSKL